MEKKKKYSEGIRKLAQIYNQYLLEDEIPSHVPHKNIKITSRESLEEFCYHNYLMNFKLKEEEKEYLK